MVTFLSKLNEFIFETKKPIEEAQLKRIRKSLEADEDLWSDDVKESLEEVVGKCQSLSQTGPSPAARSWEGVSEASSPVNLALGSCIFKVLKQFYPKIGITREGVYTVADLLANVHKNIANKII